MMVFEEGNMKVPWDAVRWWEIRRIPFNLALFVTGATTIFVFEAIGGRHVQPGEDVIEPVLLLMGVIAYGVAANACYTLGWVTEMLWSQGDTSQTQALRSKIYRQGLIFSVLLTLFPAVIVFLVWAFSGFK